MSPDHYQSQKDACISVEVRQISDDFVLGDPLPTTVIPVDANSQEIFRIIPKDRLLGGGGCATRVLRVGRHPGEAGYVVDLIKLDWWARGP